MKYKLTIFTPTYNRAYILGQLKESLCRQDCFDFEWLIIDDGSSDQTEELVHSWMKENLPYDLNYHRTKNGGKPRAINKACELAQSPWLFIVDSDDYVADNLIQFLLKEIKGIEKNEKFVGIGGLRGSDNTTPKREMPFEGYVDITNLQRKKYGLDLDCNELYRIETMKKFPFEVWPTEIFTPEEVQMNEMALQGYQVRWFNKVFVISEYQPDGMTKGAWNLIKKNPMGYAMLYNHKLKYTHKLKERCNCVCQFLALIIYARNLSHIHKCNAKILAYALLPAGVILAIRRKKQFNTL